MGNSLKVARWEIKRNMKNKSFIISLFITPIIFLVFMFVPNLFKDSGTEAVVAVNVIDELNLYGDITEAVTQQGLTHWQLQEVELSEESMIEELATLEQTVFIRLTEKSLEEGVLQLYLSEDVDASFLREAYALEEPFRKLQLQRLGLTGEQQQVVDRGITITPVYYEQLVEQVGENGEGAFTDPLKRYIPGIFAGIVLFSIVMTGMMIFQSASQEKKEKVAEIILSSLTPTELMQGKIMGYFVLGITQVAVWFAFIIPLALWKIDLPLLEYLLVPELLLYLLIALAGYLLFAAIFVGLGATVEELTATSNFQGMIMMLPFLPFLFFGPVINDPNGLIAKVGSFVPFTSPAILLMRLSLLEEWPWIELIIALIVLGLSIWLFMKLAGKIFKIGIMMYGKNATPKEIWKWLWT